MNILLWWFRKSDVQIKVHLQYGGKTKRAGKNIVEALIPKPQRQAEGLFLTASHS